MTSSNDPPLSQPTNDLDPCAQEPIHIPGSIQPHGVLLTVNPVDLTVLQIAGDVRSLLNIDPEALIGQSLKAQLGNAALERLNVLMSRAEITPRPVLVFQVTSGTAQLDVCAHTSQGLLVLEIEPHLSTPATSLELSQEMTAAIRSVETVAQLLECIASEVQRVTEFDRVMIYRFDAEGNGQVAAERRSSDAIESFLGLHYPGSDIPVQARILYKSNWIRCIPDVSYKPVPILPPDNPLTGRPVDLTFSALRSVSPIHLEYLTNMGVAASMSLSIVVRGELWGLIACHHLKPHYLNCALRGALELFAQLSSLQLTTLIELERKHRDTFRRNIQDELIFLTAAHGFPSAIADNGPLLTQLVSASGLVIRIGGKMSSWGQVPSESALGCIVEWLNEHSKQAAWSTDCLREHVPSLAAEPQAPAGMLALRVIHSQSDYLIWFLPERAATITWAGDPHRPDEAHLRMTPRKSFAKWQEQVSGRSRAWAQEEIEAVLRLRVAILEFSLIHSVEVAREREEFSKQQQLLMLELDHRVKNIFATIQAVVRFSSKGADSIIQFTQALEQRLISMARAHDLLTISRWAGASLHRLVAEELAPFCAKDDSKLQLSGDDVVLTPPIALSMSLLLHELATNAIKHGSLSVPNGNVVVSTRCVKDGSGSALVMQWIERDGPPVMTPVRKGFGRQLIEKIFQNGSGSSFDLEFEPAGVRCTVTLPLEQSTVAPADTSIATAALTAPARVEKNLQGVRVLVLENDRTASQHVAEIVREAGAEVIGPFSAIEEFMSVHADISFDVALLDVDINGGEIWSLASIIRGRNIPMVLATGCVDFTMHPEQFREAMTVRKPYDSNRLISKLKLSVDVSTR